MKKYRLLISNIRSFLIGCKMDASILMVGLIIGVNLVLIFTGILFITIEKNEDTEYEQTNMGISWQVRDPQDTNGVLDMPFSVSSTITKKEFEKRMNILLDGYWNNVSDIKGIVSEDKNPIKNIFRAYFIMDRDYNEQAKSPFFHNYFTPEELRRGAPILTYRESDYCSYPVKNKKIKLGDKEYIIKNNYLDERDSCECVIPWNSLLDDMTVTNISLNFKHPLTDKEVQTLRERVEEHFSDADTFWLPKVIELKDAQHMRIIFASSVLLMVFIIINLLLFLVYMYDKRRKENETIILCGGKENFCERLFALEISVYLIFASIVALISVKYLIVPCIRGIYGGIDSVLSLSSCLLFLAMFMVLSYLSIRLVLLVKRKKRKNGE